MHAEHPFSFADLIDTALKNPVSLLILKTLVFGGCLWPLVDPLWHLWTDPLSLGANPAEHIIRDWGDWALQLLLLTLLITPLRLALGLSGLLRFRRMLGLFAFAASCLHLLAYLAFDRLFVLAEIWADLIKRPFITLGMAAFVLLLLLALTSSRTMVMRLGGILWTRLHRLIYPASVLVVIHYALMVKRDLTEPLLYAALLGLLLAARLPRSRNWLKSSDWLVSIKKPFQIKSKMPILKR
jgi:methionine sulfoxide reductase heme-binding subunit